MNLSHSKRPLLFVCAALLVAAVVNGESIERRQRHLRAAGEGGNSATADRAPLTEFPAELKEVSGRNSSTALEQEQLSNSTMQGISQTEVAKEGNKVSEAALRIGNHLLLRKTANNFQKALQDTSVDTKFLNEPHLSSPLHYEYGERPIQTFLATKIRSKERINRVSQSHAHISTDPTLKQIEDFDKAFSGTESERGTTHGTKKEGYIENQKKSPRDWMISSTPIVGGKEGQYATVVNTIKKPLGMK